MKTYKIYNDVTIFTINDEKLDDILHANHKTTEVITPNDDMYYMLPTKEFARFIDYANCRGYNVDFENSETSVINIIETV